MNPKLTAVFAGTFDPITHGHADIIIRASKLFSQVVVAIAENSRKVPRFPLAQRIELAKAVFPTLSNVEVCGFNNLLVDFAKSKGAHVLIRGIRAVSDFDYEFQLAAMNKKLAPEIETIFLTPSEEFSFLSSSLIAEVSSLGGDVSHYVHPEVLKALLARK